MLNGATVNRPTMEGVEVSRLISRYQVAMKKQVLLMKSISLIKVYTQCAKWVSYK